MFRNRFWISLALSIPVLLYSDLLQMWFGFAVPVFLGSQWIAPIFATLVFLIGGVPFLRMAVPEVRNRQPGMMVLISLAITVAYVYSLATMVINPANGFFWELVTLIDIMLLGHWLEMRSVRQASGALQELAKLMPDTAERIAQDGTVETVSASQLQTGDLLLVRPGASVPADAQVVEGESRPVKKRPGDTAIAGTINGDGSLRLGVVERHWLALIMTGLGMWTLAPLLAPLFMHWGWTGPGQAIYAFYSLFCHQPAQPRALVERSRR